MKREELLKVAKPILFNTEMVQAILEGRKTVTRRVIKLKNGYHLEGNASEVTENIKLFGSDAIFYEGWETTEKLKPPYKVDDILYIRETWAKIEDFINYADVEINQELKYLFKCDDEGKEHAFIDVGVKRWRPSIHMPKKIARIFLKVTDIRVERLQDITVGDIENEGYPGEIDFSTMPVAMQGIIFEWWASTWNSTIKKQDLDKYGWKANPWVWVIEFEKMEKTKRRILA